MEVSYDNIYLISALANFGKNMYFLKISIFCQNGKISFSENYQENIVPLPSKPLLVSCITFERMIFSEASKCWKTHSLVWYDSVYDLVVWFRVIHNEQMYQGITVGGGLLALSDSLSLVEQGSSWSLRYFVLGLSAMFLSFFGLAVKLYRFLG